MTASKVLQVAVELEEAMQSVDARQEALRRSFLSYLEHQGRGSDSDIARKMCVSPQYVGDIKSGRRIITLQFIQRLKRTLGQQKGLGQPK